MRKIKKGDVYLFCQDDGIVIVEKEKPFTCSHEFCGWNVSIGEHYKKHFKLLEAAYLFNIINIKPSKLAPRCKIKAKNEEKIDN